MRAGQELAFFNGAVFDGGRFAPAGTVVRVSNGTITYVGSQNGAGPLSDAEPVDLRGGTQWITGGGWSMEAFPGGVPTRDLLDGVVSDRPVYLLNRDGHGAWANSKALGLASITRATPGRGHRIGAARARC